MEGKLVGVHRSMRGEREVEVSTTLGGERCRAYTPNRDDGVTQEYVGDARPRKKSIEEQSDRVDEYRVPTIQGLFRRRGRLRTDVRAIRNAFGTFRGPLSSPRQ